MSNIRLSTSTFLTIFIFHFLFCSKDSNLYSQQLIHNRSIGILEKNKGYKIELIENFSIGEKEANLFIYLTHIVIDKKGDIFALDKGDFKIHKFDKNRKYIQSFGNKGNGPGEFIKPIDMGITPNGILCILDSRRMRVVKYDVEGTFINEFSYSGGRQQKSILCPSNNTIVIMGRPLKDKIFQIYDLDGKFIRSAGELIETYNKNRKYLLKMSKYTQIYHRTPFFAYIDKNDNIIHPYSYSNRMRIFDSNFNVKLIIQRDDPDFTPVLKNRYQQTSGAISILRLSDGKIIKFISYSKDWDNPDDDFKRIEIYDKNGKYLAGERLKFNGYGLAVDADDNILFVINDDYKSYIVSYKLNCDKNK